MPHCPARTGPRTVGCRGGPPVGGPIGERSPPRSRRPARASSTTATPTTPTGTKPVEATPVHGAHAALRQRRPDETAQQRVARTRRQTPAPGEHVPGDGPREGGSDGTTIVVGIDGDDAGYRRRDRGAEQDRPEHVADRGEHRGRPGRAARVATSVAIAFAASCTPLVKAKARAMAKAAMRTDDITTPCAGDRPRIVPTSGETLPCHRPPLKLHRRKGVNVVNLQTACVAFTFGVGAPASGSGRLKRTRGCAKRISLTPKLSPS